jgi:aryl-alcohol dehydrogenase-like predicted oxidoreductase
MGEQITLGDTLVARIGLGTNRLTNTPENVAFVQEAVAAGIGLIDTAHVYTGGESEKAIGAALSASDGDCVVATKGGYENGRPETLRAQIEQSLRSLRTDSIGLYYLHKVDPETPLEESLGAIKEYRDRGAIREVGVSNVSVEQVERARQIVPIAAVQNHYNLAEREHDDVVDHCAANGIVFVPYFPLRGVDQPAQTALAWLLRRSPSTLPIPGTLSLEHVKENLAAAEIELTDDEFEALTRR